MGSSNWRENERIERECREALAAEKAKEEKARNALAAKIVMVVTDQIVRDIIRPGPVAEERECYDMAQELRDHDVALKRLVASVLKVSDEEDGDGDD